MIEIVFFCMCATSAFSRSRCRAIMRVLRCNREMLKVETHIIMCNLYVSITHRLYIVGTLHARKFMERYATIEINCLFHLSFVSFRGATIPWRTRTYFTSLYFRILLELLEAFFKQNYYSKSRRIKISMHIVLLVLKRPVRVSQLSDY